MIAASSSPSESAGGAQEADTRERLEIQGTAIFVLPNSVILSHPDYTKIEAIHGTDHGAPLTPEMRDRLMFLEEVSPPGGFSW